MEHLSTEEILYGVPGGEGPEGVMISQSYCSSRYVIGNTRSEARPVAPRRKHPRNAPCRCGSGKKYKRCCMKRDEEIKRKLFEE